MEYQEVAIVRLLSDVEYEGNSRRVGKVGVFCVEGPLRIGDILNSADDSDGVRYPIKAEIIEIQFFDHLLGSLDPVYSANLVLSGEIGPIGEGWTVHAIRPSDR